MTTFTVFAVAYVLGGLTFLPLLLAAILVPAWLLLPQLKDTSDDESRKSVLGGEDDAAARREARLAAQEEKSTGSTADGAASGIFAVLRSHHLPSAVTALNAKSNGNGGTAGVNGSTDGTAEAGGNSESVYQSMYRSVFDRKKDTNTASSVLEGSNAAEGSTAAGGSGSAARTKSKTVVASVFYIVLRHGHLMLYDSPAQLEVRHVISLAHHSISLSEGEGPNGEILDPTMDGDLFIKRTAIVLTPIDLPNGKHQQQQRTAHPKPFYLFSSTCSEKEDFYHALLTTRSRPPIPLPILPESIIKLQSNLHSTSLTPETRAFNALIGRIFLAINRTPFLEQFIRSKIEKKIARVSKPAFIASLAVKSIDLGDAAPVLSNPRLKDINISGDMTIAFDVRYTGGVQVVIAALAKLDLGPRFKARTVDVVLATSLQRMSAHVLVRVKPPPSNRIWFCFESVPEMEIKVEPVVSSRQITYTFILRAIEERIRSVIAETLVRPNWDDVPFFDTRGQRVRGGIWADEGGEEADAAREAARPVSAAERLSARNDKTMSMPDLQTTADADASESSLTSPSSESLAAMAASTASTITSSLQAQQPNGLKKRRTLAAAPLPRSGNSSAPNLAAAQPPPPKPLRSPSFTVSASPAAPSVAVDDANGLPVRSDDATLQPAPAKKKWRSSAAAATQQGKRMEAVEAMREMRDRSAVPSAPDEATTLPIDAEAAVLEGTSAAAAAAVLNTEPEDLLEDTAGEGSPENASLHDGEVGDEDRHPWSGTSGTPRTNSNESLGASSTKSGAQRRQEQRKNLLAATAAATSAARNWGWNALANAKAGRQGQQQAGSPSQGPRSGQQANTQRARNTAAPPVSSHNTSPSSSAHHLPPPYQQHQEPIGRGQPLPPPGTPLPGPEKPAPKSLWSAAAGLAAGRVGGGSVKRKPVLPPRRTGSARGAQHGGAQQEEVGQGDYAGRTSGESMGRNMQPQDRRVHGEEEFGPWNENSGIATPTSADEVAEADADVVGDDGESIEDVSADATSLDNITTESPHTSSLEEAENAPPPLPPRRRKAESNMDFSPVERQLSRDVHGEGESHGIASASSTLRDEGEAEMHEHGYKAASVHESSEAESARLDAHTGHDFQHTADEGSHEPWDDTDESTQEAVRGIEDHTADTRVGDTDAPEVDMSSDVGATSRHPVVQEDEPTASLQPTEHDGGREERKPRPY